MHVFPSLRQLLLICLVWAAVAWYTVAVWAMKATDTGWTSAFSYFYAVRAPAVGALMGLLWSPVFALGYHPRRLKAAHVEGRDVFAEDTRMSHWLRFADGAINGQLVGASISFVLLYLWPIEMQNTRLEAIKWAAVFWKLYWYMFVPAAGFAGVTSVWMALRHRETPAFRSAGLMSRLRHRHDDDSESST